MDAVMAGKFARRLRLGGFRSILCGTVLCLFPALLRAGNSVVLAWSPSISSDVVGYRIYYGTASGNYTSQVAVGLTNSATLSGLADGATYYFSATSFDSAGAESPYSNEAVYTVPTAATLTVMPGSGLPFRFTVTGISGAQYVVQASTNLMDWDAVQTNTAPFCYWETNAVNSRQCFYRAICLLQ